MENNEQLLNIVSGYRDQLHKKIRDRELEMQKDKNDHYLVYGILGFSKEEGYQIDYQQNVGRFLYKYAGAMMEDLVVSCLETAYPDARKKVKIPNPTDNSPKTVEIDCLVGKYAYEIKWRDATTDGDHIRKEHKRVKIIHDAGYIPVRLMFFEPDRTQAAAVQEKLKKLYEDIGGEYYSGQEAWDYILEKTGIDLKHILENMR